MKKYLAAAAMAVGLSVALPAAAHAGCSISATTDFQGNTSATLSCQLF
jgi:hypothetical protein